jgi:hypothetical protein
MTAFKETVGLIIARLICITLLNSPALSDRLETGDLKGMDFAKEPSIIKMLNLGLAFALELVMLAILLYTGMALGQSLPVKIGLAIALPAVVSVIWGIWLAPTSKTRLRDPWMSILKTLLFSLTAALLYFTGLKELAIGFEVTVIFNLILLYIYR